MRSSVVLQGTPARRQITPRYFAVWGAVSACLQQQQQQQQQSEGAPVQRCVVVPVDSVWLHA